MNNQTLADKLKKASMNIMISNGLKIIGVIMYKFKIQITDNMPDNALAYVKWVRKKEEFTLVPNIYFSKECEKLSIGQLTFILIHEIMHVLNMHGNRGIDKHGELFNLAADHTINIPIVKESESNQLVEKLEHFVIFDEWKDENLTTEEVYDRLLKNANFVTINNVTIGKNGEIVADVTMPDGERVTITSSPKGNGQDEKEIKSEVDGMKGDVRAMLDSDQFKSIQRGLQNSSIVEYLDELTTVKIPWDKLLEKAIKSHVSTTSENRSWKSLNKRMRARGVMLPSHPKDDRLHSNMYALIDNSGSISTEDLKKFGSIIMDSIRHFNQIKVIKHSVEVNEIITIDSTMDSSEITKGVGRGGTAHNACFDVIEDDFVETDSTDIGLVLILTDYMSNIEDIWDAYTWTKEVPIKVILTEAHPVSKEIDDSPILIDKL